METDTPPPNDVTTIRQLILTLSPASIYGGTMRLVKKRKVICFALLVTVMVFMLMVAQTIVVEFSSSVSLPSAQAGLAHLIPSSDTDPVSSQLKYLESPTPAPAPASTARPKIQCSPVHNIAFVKTHKAGSSTIANILQRYGVKHRLNFALPNRRRHSSGYNYITKPGEVLTRAKIIPLPNDQEYNILFNHAVYNRTAFHEIMPGNTMYITILREPFQQFVSAFEYYGMVDVFGAYNPDILASVNPISTYLSNPYKYDLGINYFSYVKNKQAEDLGLRKPELFSPTKLRQYIQQMDTDFRLVMIMEHFDESLLMLKHELCWETIDILYIPQNANKHKPRRNFTQDDFTRHQRLNHLDYSLYSHYSSIFNDKLNSRGPDFFQELTHFKMLLSQVKHNCMSQTTFLVSESRWHRSFNVTEVDCVLMLMPELRGLDFLLNRMSGSAINDYVDTNY